MAAAVVVFLATLAVALGWIVFRRRRLSRAPVIRIERSPPHVVLVHGLAGFEEIRWGSVRASYFRGVRERLEQVGISCTAARLPSLATVAERSRALEALLASLGNVEGHVIAHSMGGLDARRALHALGGRSVRSLVTVATPHRGTPLAQLGQALPRTFLRDLSCDAAHTMNGELPDVPGVRYGSVLVAPARGASGVHPLLRASYLLLRALAGDNDGLVPLASQGWGDTLATIDADHWGAIGWSGTFDAPAFYEDLVKRQILP